jgi:hypothetical protein
MRKCAEIRNSCKILFGKRDMKRADAKRLSKWIIMKWDGRVWIAFAWLRTVAGGWPL